MHRRYDDCNANDEACDGDAEVDDDDDGGDDGDDDNDIITLFELVLRNMDAPILCGLFRIYSRCIYR